jgi:hypothetical protein
VSAAAPFFALAGAVMPAMTDSAISADKMVFMAIVLSSEFATLDQGVHRRSL